MPTPVISSTPTRTPTTTPIVCGYGYAEGTHFYVDCCGEFISSKDGNELIILDYTKSSWGVIRLNTPATTTCLTPTPTRTPTNTPTPTNTTTPTNTPTPTSTNTPTPTSTKVNVEFGLKNECDVITLFPMNAECFTVKDPSGTDTFDGVLTINVTGGTSPYRYFWNGINGSKTKSGLPPGDYSITVVDFYGDFTANTVCSLFGPTPTPTPTPSITPSATPISLCKDLCVSSAGFFVSYGPWSFKCNGMYNGKYRWTYIDEEEEIVYNIIWVTSRNRWEIVDQGLLNPIEFDSGVMVSNTTSDIPLSSWIFVGGQGQSPTINVIEGIPENEIYDCQGCDPEYNWESYTQYTCYGVKTEESTPPLETIELVRKTAKEYSDFGSNIYQDDFNVDGTGSVLINLSSPNIWKNNNTFIEGPLNRCALWTPNSFLGEPLNVWVGFSDCLTGITESKVYYVGIGADNHYRLVLDGVEILNTISRGSNQEMFKYWNIYPIYIGDGSHIIEIFGLNTELIAGFGCEIYDNTLDDLINAQNYSDLNVVFTTDGKTEALIVQTTGNTYLTSGYTCPNGYRYSSCDDICVKTEFCSTGICPNNFPLSLNVSVQNAQCSNSPSGSIIATALYGNSPYQYSINNGLFSNNNVFNNLSSGQYSIRVRDLNNNVVEQIVNITNNQNPLTYELSLHNDGESIISIDNKTSQKTCIYSVKSNPQLPTGSIITFNLNFLYQVENRGPWSGTPENTSQSNLNIILNKNGSDISNSLIIVPISEQTETIDRPNCSPYETYIEYTGLTSFNLTLSEGDVISGTTVNLLELLNPVIGENGCASEIFSNLKISINSISINGCNCCELNPTTNYIEYNHILGYTG